MPLFSKTPCPGVNAGDVNRTLMLRVLLQDTSRVPLGVMQYCRHLVNCIPRLPSTESTEELIRVGGIEKLVQFLGMDDSSLQKEAAWVLSKVAAGPDAHAEAVVQADSVPPLVRLLSSKHPSVQEFATRCLATITFHVKRRDVVLENSVLPPLLPLLLSEGNLLKLAFILLMNLCHERTPPPSLSSLVPCLSTLCRLASHSDNWVSYHSCFCLHSLHRMYGHSLIALLDPAFIASLPKLARENPFQRPLQDIVHTLGQAGSTSAMLTQPPMGSVWALQSPLGSTTHTPTKGWSRSPSPLGVSTRSTPKRLKFTPPDPIKASPVRPRTRTFTRHLKDRTPNHEASHILQLKDKLFRAVEEGEVECVEQLVQDTGPSITRGRSRCTLLHAAATNNQPHVALFLLQFISPNVVNQDGETPVHLAAKKGHTQVLNILLADPQVDPDKRDPSNNTYKQTLASHLLEAVLEENTTRIRSLLGVGADPDCEVPRAAQRLLARELQVTTARQLGLALHCQHILKMFPEKRMPKSLNGRVSKVTTNTWGGSPANPLHHLPLGPLRLDVTGPTVVVRGPGIYRTETNPRGYVCILSYSDFKERPDLRLEGSQTDAHNLATVFDKMGYSGHVHFSLTADQTRKELARVRDMEVLQTAGCAVFVISSHGVPHQGFLTSDMKLLDTQWVLDFFKDSQCPQLKNKPKLFIWDLCRGYYQASDQGSRGGQRCRVDEPLQDVMCLYSSSGGFTGYTFTKDGTPFTKTLCCTLARHAHDKEFGELYRELLQEYDKTNPGAVAELNKIGFTKRFYFNPVTQASPS